MPLLMRTVTYASLFIGLVLVFLPARLLSWLGVVTPRSLGVFQIGGVVIATIGAGLALWCVGTFVRLGRGTPAPFDPPRRLVVAGPYRFVRNPMYLGAGLALAGAALFYTSWWLVGYLGLTGVYEAGGSPTILPLQPAHAAANFFEHDFPLASGFDHHEFFHGHVRHGIRYAADTQSGCPTPGKGHPIDTKRRVVVDHDGCCFQVAGKP